MPLGLRSRAATLTQRVGHGGLWDAAELAERGDTVVKFFEGHAGCPGTEELLQLTQCLPLYASAFRGHLDSGHSPVGIRPFPTQQARGDELVDIGGDRTSQHVEIFVQQAGSVEARVNEKDDAQRAIRDRILALHGLSEGRDHALHVHHGAKEVDDVGIVGSPNGVGHDATILGVSAANGVKTNSSLSESYALP